MMKFALICKFNSGEYNHISRGVSYTVTLVALMALTARAVYVKHHSRNARAG